MFHNASVFPDVDAARAVVTFRIPNSLLVFKHERDEFVSDVDLTVELHRNGEKVADRRWRKKHTAANFEATQSRTRDVDGWVHFEVDPGEYTYRLLVRDQGDDERGMSRPFQVPEDVNGAIGSLVFGHLQSDSQRVALDPASLGGGVPFGADVQTIVPVVLGSSAAAASEATGARTARDGDAIPVAGDTSFSYQLYRVAESGRAFGTGRSRSEARGASIMPPVAAEVGADDVLVSSGTVPADALVPIGRILETEDECLCWTAPQDEKTRFAVIPLQTDRLENGSYILEMASPNGGMARTFGFRTEWRDMPLSLYDIDVAIRHLEFTEDRETIRALSKGSREAQIDAFNSYWKDRDPTPGTAFNELMNEYYRRIDHAAFQFRTGRHPFPDGLRTDAARIYIVYGPPDDISSTLPSSGGVERTWTYADGRRFIFRAADSLAPLELQETVEH